MDLLIFATGSFCWFSKSGKHLLYELHITMFAFSPRIEICFDKVSCLFTWKKVTLKKFNCATVVFTSRISCLVVDVLLSGILLLLEAILWISLLIH